MRQAASRIKKARGLREEVEAQLEDDGAGDESFEDDESDKLSDELSVSEDDKCLKKSLPEVERSSLILGFIGGLTATDRRDKKSVTFSDPIAFSKPEEPASFDDEEEKAADDLAPKPESILWSLSKVSYRMGEALGVQHRQTLKRQFSRSVLAQVRELGELNCKLPEKYASQKTFAMNRLNKLLGRKYTLASDLQQEFLVILAQHADQFTKNHYFQRAVQVAKKDWLREKFFTHGQEQARIYKSDALAGSPLDQLDSSLLSIAKERHGEGFVHYYTMVFLEGFAAEYGDDDFQMSLPRDINHEDFAKGFHCGYCYHENFMDDAARFHTPWFQEGFAVARYLRTLQKAWLPSHTETSELYKTLTSHDFAQMLIINLRNERVVSMRSKLVSLYNDVLSRQGQVTAVCESGFFGEKPNRRPRKSKKRAEKSEKQGLFPCGQRRTWRKQQHGVSADLREQMREFKCIKAGY